MLVLESISFIIFGLILGSFATAIIHREPQKISWGLGGEKPAQEKPHRSACQSCDQPLLFRDLVPVFSWLLLKGKCRHCQTKISPGYLWIELGCAITALLVYLSFGMAIHSAFLLIVLPFLAALLVIDLRHMILPNKLVLMVGVIGMLRLVIEGFVFETINPAIVGMNYVFAAFMYAGLALLLSWFFRSVFKKEALGFGDVKFFAVAGLWLGLFNLSYFCIGAGILGVIVAIIWKAVKKESVFPFGPALILSFYGLLLLDGSLF